MTEYEITSKHIIYRDLLDGQAKDLQQTERIYDELIKVFKEDCYCKQVAHVTGNHELYNFTREEMSSKSKIGDGFIRPFEREETRLLSTTKGKNTSGRLNIE